MDEQSVRELADYFTTGKQPAGVAELPPPPGPVEGGQGEVGELTEEGKMALALAARGELTTLGERIPDVSKGGTIERPGPPGGGAGEVGAVLPGQGMRDEDIHALAEYFTQGQKGPLGPAAQVGLAATGPAGPALEWLANQVPAFRDYIKSNVAAGLENVITGAASLGRWPLVGLEAAGVAPGPLKFLSDRLKSIQEGAVPAIKETAETLLPTSQDLDQSPLGQIASGAGQLGAQIPFGLVGGAVGLTVGLATQLAGQTYDDARAKGADDQTSQIAALWSAAAAPVQAALLHNLPIGNLSKMLAGTTPAKAIMDVGRGLVFGGATGGGLQLYQNFVARMTGYDANRPLDEGVYQQALFGAAVDGLATAASRVPGMIRYARPAQVEVRERPGAPPVAEQTPQPTEAVPPVPTAAAAPTEPLAQAAAQVRESTGASPEEILAQQGTPDQALATSQADLNHAVAAASGIAQPVPAAEPVQPAPETPVTAPAPTAPAPTAEAAANLRGEALPPPLPTEAEVPITSVQVKDTVNQASESMGLDSRIHYVESADKLPNRVQKALTEGQHGGTAQTVYDKSLSELWVIGDRFSNQQELNRALIHDTLPRIYGRLADLQIENNPADPRLGYYDLRADRPVLNEAAIMRTANPFEAASKTALEEIVAHQGVTKLFGSREAASYVQAMTQVRQRFDSLKLSDTLAQEKGFKNLDDMAKEYGFQDYASNPRHNNALTEELWADYAQRFKTLDAIENNSPSWYRQAINTLSGGLRRRFGLGISDLDVQNLVSDSFGALRSPKYGTPSEFHPEVAGQAKSDMAAYQLASLRGGEEGGAQGDLFGAFGRAEQERRQGEEAAAGRLPPPAPPPSEKAQIGTEFVRARAAELSAALGPVEALRAQPLGLASEESRPFSERMGYLAEDAGAIYEKRGFDTVMNEARAIFHEQLGGDIYRAMDDLRAMGESTADAHPAMRAVINEETNRQINTLREQGLENAARGMEIARDRFNREMAPKVTALAQALNAQKLLYETGTTAIGRLEAALTKAQEKGVGRAAGVKGSLDQVRRIGVDTINRLLERSRAQLEPLQRMIDERFNNPQSLAQRYINALAGEINNRMARLGFSPAEKPILQELFNRFQRSIQEMINEKAAPIPTPEAAKRMSSTDTIRETLGNFPMFERAWEETVTRLKTENPNSLFFSRLDHALAEPFGERAVGRVVRESGQSLRDLIFKHYDSQRRIGNTLAQGLVRDAGMAPEQAFKIQELFDRHYRNLLNATARNELEQTLARLGAPARRAKGELERLIDLMAIGGLDKTEYHNLLAPRFRLGQWSPEIIGRMKEVGGMLQKLRDEGGPEVYKNQLAAQLSDEIAKQQPRLDINIRRAEGLWMASLLTGPFTHGSYYGQNLAQVMTNLALRSLFRPGMTLGAVGKTYSDMFGAMIHSARTELPYLIRTGVHTQRELPGGEVYGARAEGIPYRSALEATPLPGGMQNPLNWYRYVGRFLHGMETVFYRGASAGITRALADRVAAERGLGSEDAQRWVEQVVYGTENDRQEAIQQAAEEQKRFKFDDAMRERRVQELIDQKRLARAPELADEAHRFALHSIYRESPYGFLGEIARKLSGFRRDHPEMSAIMPFINLPANVANEFMNWTPIGILRGRDALLGGGTEAIQKLYKEVPQFERLVEKGGEKGGISERELRDLSYEYLAKGAIGTIGMAALGAMTLANQDNPDPPFAVNGAGPADLAHRDELRAAGWQPYSIKIGDRYFDYQASPWKSMLGLVGGMADEIKYGKGDPQNWVGALATTALKDGLATVTDASFLQGLQTLLAAGGGTGGPGVDYKIQQFLSQEISSAIMIPFGGTGTKQLYRAFDPREFTGKGVLEMVLRNLPFTNAANLEPKLNALGEPVEINPLHRLLVAPTVETSDPVWRFLDQHNIGLAVPNAGRKVDGVQMTPAELHEFTLARGQYLKAELADAINSSDFRALDRDQMDAQVKELERAADEVGKYQIWQRRGGGR